MKITLAALTLGFSLTLNTGCMTVTGNCISAAHGGNVDNNHQSIDGNSSPVTTDSGCRVSTNINYISIGRPTASATLENARGEAVGSAWLGEDKDGVVVAAKVHGLAPGKYAIGVHAVGKCDPPDFLSAGPYLNRTGNGKSRLGNLPNFEVSANGMGDAWIAMKGATLDDRRNGLLGPDGAAIVIHRKVDGIAKDANASRRIACGVVKRNSVELDERRDDE